MQYCLFLKAYRNINKYTFLFLGAIDKTENNKQVLDKLQVERERGITVKAQTASLFYNYEGKQYLLNLIDTPVSFNINFVSVVKVSFVLIVQANPFFQFLN